MRFVSRSLVLALFGLLTLPACIEHPPEEELELATTEDALEAQGVSQLAPCKRCPPDAGTGTDAGTPDAGTGGGSDAGVPSGCLAGPVLSSLGKSQVLTGAKMTDDVAVQAPVDIRYMYLAGGLFDSVEPCASCLSCRAGGLSCANSSGGC
ncbi:MAG TPA: hypothetical protein VK458_25445, partial [Myxococcaceae bacterium]|nr:hypothetical protein [Myxococcaceae bacterium]